LEDSIHLIIAEEATLRKVVEAHDLIAVVSFVTINIGNPRPMSAVSENQPITKPKPSYSHPQSSSNIELSSLRIKEGNCFIPLTS
jgi:hypothetical protein